MMPIKRKTVVDRGWEYNRAVIGQVADSSGTRAIVPIAGVVRASSLAPSTVKVEEPVQGSFVEVGAGSRSTGGTTDAVDITSYDRGMGEEDPYMAGDDEDDLGVYAQILELALKNDIPDWTPTLTKLTFDMGEEVVEVLDCMKSFSFEDLEKVVDMAAEAQLDDLSDTEVRGLCLDYLRSKAWDTLNPQYFAR